MAHLAAAANPASAHSSSSAPALPAAESFSLTAATQSELMGSHHHPQLPSDGPTAMDISDDEKKGEGGPDGGHIRPHHGQKRQRQHTQETCSRLGCTRRLTKKDTHRIDGARVCSACWSKHYSAEHPTPAPSSSSSSAAAPVLRPHAPVTRSYLPAIPTEHSFATHDWEIVRASDDLRDVAHKWVALGRDPRVSVFPRTYIQSNPDHRQFSILTARHTLRDVDRLATRTELLIRNVMNSLSPAEATRFNHLHLVAFKHLTSIEGAGLQQLHYDVVDRSTAAKVMSALIYCTNTVSTDLPLYDAATMAPAFIAGNRATDSEQRTIEGLMRDDHFRSFPVKAGDVAIFRGNVCHRGINNPNPEDRVAIYLLFSPLQAKNQDGQQRVPIELPLFAPLSPERRWSIITFSKAGYKMEAICMLVGCSDKTVYHWRAVYHATGTVDDLPRSGRPRVDVPSLRAEAEAHPFSSTPRMLKSKMRLPVSKRTIRRRLNDDSLFGRKSRRFFFLDATSIRKRLSFANGYHDWSEDKWMTVLFADEKTFTLGMHGRPWVQRPRNADWDPRYSYEGESHPPKVNFWGCFSGRGVGGCETFRDNNTGKKMAGIINFHFPAIREKLFNQRPLQPWWLLWDNAPTHKEGECQRALHNNGVNCMELPPYSPDLNPMEHLLADLARRVEQRFPSTVDELEEAIHFEWPLTDTDFLRQLARSMPRRIEAVLHNQGHGTKY
jgi:hypothetical protein